MPVLALATSSAGAGEILTGRVDHVADGDTLTLALSGRPRVRLYGIDAPEMRQDCADATGRPYPCGARAKSILEALTAGKVGV